MTTFIGLVRDHNAGRRVLWIDYEAHEPLARRVFARIGGEARERWPGAALAIHHRIGRVEIGEASVVIAAASAHRAEAFAACRFAIERVKQIAPVWKHEHFEGGDVWIEGATADPEDEAALRRRSRAGMLVTIRLFARLRELAGHAELRRDLPDESTVRTAWDADGQRVSVAGRLRAVALGRGQRRLRPLHDDAAGRRRGRVPAAGIRRLAQSRSAVGCQTQTAVALRLTSDSGD